MPHDRPPLTGEDNRWLDIEAAARALGVTIAHARVLASRDKWRRTRHKTAPRTWRVEYLYADIRTTHQRRNNP